MKPTRRAERLEQLGELGRELRQAFGDGTTAESATRRLARQEERLLEALQRRSGAPAAARHRFARNATLALACGSALIVAWWWVSQREADGQLRCWTNAGRPVRDGDVVEASADSARVLSFADGSSTRLERGAKLELLRRAERRVHLRLKRGAVSCDIRPRSGYSWTFQAGPYAVRVVGTSLKIRWNAPAARLEVAVLRGAVRVSGGMLAQQEVELQRGQVLRADAVSGWQRKRVSEEDRATTENITSPQPRGSEATPPVDGEAAEPARAGSARSAASQRRGTGPVAKLGQRWKALARGERFDDALAEIRRIGFERVLAEAAPADLLLLADTSRLGDRPAWALRALLFLRKRFRHSTYAALAAFRLGRLAYDAKKDYREAARWLAVFLAERPDHELAADARGRLFVSLHRAGDAKQARAAARRYLQSDPGGAYAATARAIILGLTN